MRLLLAALFIVVVGCGTPEGRPPVGGDGDGGSSDDGGSTKSDGGSPIDGGGGGDRDGGTKPCGPGFELVNGVCRDINECRTRPCSPDAQCSNTEGSFICKCNPGYIGDGFKCMPQTGGGSELGGECSPFGGAPFCAGDLFCIPTTENEDSGLCTRDCRSSRECGGKGTCLQGYCVERCQRGVDECDRKGFVCYEGTLFGADADFCFEPCTVVGPEVCGPGTSCNPTTGRCEDLSCTDSSTCPRGTTCANTPQGRQCVADCTAGAACPPGLFCNAGSGACEPIASGDTNQPCGSQVGLNECFNSGDYCAPFSRDPSRPGLCLSYCASDANCIGGGQCDLRLPNGARVCEPPPCNPTGPNTCVPGTTCTKQADGSAWCAP